MSTQTKNMFHDTKYKGGSHTNLILPAQNQQKTAYYLQGVVWYLSMLLSKLKKNILKFICCISKGRHFHMD